MGLDIYFKRTHCSQETHGTDFNKVYDDDCKEAKKDFAKVYDRGLKKLAKLNTPETVDEYNKALHKWLVSLAAFPNYPHFDMKELGIKFDYGKYKTIFPETIEYDTLTAMRDSVIEHIGPRYDAYFRKANFIYRYFMPNLVDESAWVTESDVDDIIDRCEKVLKNNSLCKKLLPTQEGFFFGSTEYDEWYFEQVKEAIEEMNKLKKGMKKGWNYYVSMSW